MTDQPFKYEVIDRERHGGTLRLGEGTAIGRGTSIDTSCNVVLKDGAVISDDVLILTHDHEPGSMEKRYSTLVIGEKAWIGARATILESCKRIGDGAVVGAASVVTHSIPAHELWAGNPARLVRRLED